MTGPEGGEGGCDEKVWTAHKEARRCIEIVNSILAFELSSQMCELIPLFLFLGSTTSTTTTSGDGWFR